MLTTVAQAALDLHRHKLPVPAGWELPDERGAVNESQARLRQLCSGVRLTSEQAGALGALYEYFTIGKATE
ncbi:MAG: hypothetical protein ACR2HR_18115 [Euzebya sp.]